MKRLLHILILGGLLALAGSVDAAPPAPYVNILKNGNFGSSFSEWVRGGSAAWDVIDEAMYIHSPTTNNGGILQDTGYSASTADRYEVQLEIGNTSASAKDVVLIVGTTDGSNLVSCQWTVAPNSPLQLYRMQTLAPGAWANIRFIFRVTTQDSLPAVMVDNLHLFYSPGALNATTVCTEPPAPTATPFPTPTPGPDTSVMWALPTQVIGGTPQPAQYARLSYDFTAGDLAVSVLLAAVLFTLLCVFTVWLLIGRKAK